MGLLAHSSHISQIGMDLDPGARFTAARRSAGTKVVQRWAIGRVLLIGWWLAGCHPRESPPAPERCGPAVPESAQHPVVGRAITLAGQYDLIQVQTQPKAGATSVGRLYLAQPDSLARASAVGGAARDLIGWLETVKGDTVWRPGAGSRDPNHPGAVLSGDHLRLGQLGSLDASVEHLTITAVAAEGFWGWWKADPGLGITTDGSTRRVLPDPAGYFCALRARP
jgi:hypothetical protein